MYPLLLTILFILLSTASVSFGDNASLLSVDDFQSKDTPWQFLNGPEYPGARGQWQIKDGIGRNGSRGGELSFDFSGGGNYVQAGVALPKAKDVSALRLWIKKPHANSFAARFTDSQGQTFQKTFNIASTDWQEVEIGLSAWAVSWGGKSDGVFRGNPTEFAIVIDNNSDRSGAVVIDDIRLVTGLPGKSGPNRVSYTALTFKDGGGLSTDLALFGKPQKLLLDVNADGPGVVKVLVGSHFHSYQTEITVASAGRQTISSPMGGMEVWKTEGAEEGLLFPLRLLLIQPDRGIKLEKLQIETEIDIGGQVVLIPEGTMAEGKAHFTCRVQSILGAYVKGRLEYTVRNWSGEQISAGSIPVEIPAGESVVKTTTIAAAGIPFLECEYRFVTPDCVYGPAIGAATAGMSDAGSAKSQRSSPWGIGVYLYRYPSDGAGLEKMDKAAAMAQAAGVKWSREEMQWHRIEPKKGEYDWSFYDRVVETAGRHGITIYGLIAYWSNWTKPYTMEGVADYANYCKVLVSRYKDRIKHWEIWNEPNIFFWSGPKELYPELLKAAYKAIKEVDPEAVVLGCSTAGIDGGFVEMTQRAGAPYDILTIHPYRAYLNDVGFMQELRDTAALTAKTGGKVRPVWITEMGWPTPIGGISEREQAKLLARCYLSALASGVETNMSWYNFRDDGDNPFYLEHRFGVIRSDLTPKPAYRALASVCRALPNAKLDKAVKMQSGVLGYTFTTENGDVTVMWSSGQGAIASLEHSGAGFSAADLMGQPVETLVIGKTQMISLQAGSPVFIKGVATEANAPYRIEIPQTIRAGQPVTISVTGGDREGFCFALGELKIWKIKKDPHAAIWRVTPPRDATGKTEATLNVSHRGKTIRVPLVLDVSPEIIRV